MLNKEKETLELSAQGLKDSFAWIETNRMRLHAADCIVHQPSARCSCGLHRVLTDIRGIITDLETLANA